MGKMSTSDERRRAMAQVVHVVAMESNKAANVVVVANAVASQPAQKQIQSQIGAETNNNNNNNNVSSKRDLCHESAEMGARARDCNSSQAGEKSSSASSSSREQRVSSAHDKQQQQQQQQQERRDSVSSTALQVERDEEATTKVKSSSDLDDNGDQDRQRHRAPLAAPGDMSAQKATEADGGGGGGSSGARNAQLAESTPRDKQQRDEPLEAAAGEQVEQTLLRGALEQPEQRQPQLKERADAEAKANAGRVTPAPQVGEAAPQGQGQGQLLVSAAPSRAKQTNSVDQNKTLSATATVARQEDEISDKCNGISTNYSTIKQNHQLTEKENQQNNINNGVTGDHHNHHHHHHILELPNNQRQNHHLETTTNNKDNCLPYFTTTSQHNTPYFKSHKQLTQHQATTKRLSYLQALLLRRWPCCALTICIMSSLLFGFLLSAATVLLMHGFANCHTELAHLSASMSATSGADQLPTILANGAHHTHNHNQHVHRPHDQHHASASLLPTPLGLADSLAATPTEVDRRLGLDGGSGPLLPASFNAASAADDNKQLTNKTSLPRGDFGAAQAHFQRLPSAIMPQHYNLFIWPQIVGPSFPFNGSVEIRLTCRNATANITLHSLELAILENSIKLSKWPQPAATIASTRKRRQAIPAIDAAGGIGGAPTVTRLSQDKQLQYSIIHLDAPLEVGQDYLLRLDFAGKLNDDLAGFYRMNYERQNSSEPTWIAATQFQATDARRAFPCFDEPLYKATFSIKIRHWINMTALSNMPIVSSEKSPDGLWITDTFAKSQRMSTYLVAWAVTNFESRTAGNITVWTRPGFVHTAQYALEIAERILRHYEDFFGIAYPLPKMDMIALPDFNAGAMENWGLITYRETAMLYDPESSSVANKQRVAVVVAHELAHQWFGNLVTPKWWDDLWLNEGFASFVEYLGVDHVEPRWRMLEQFTVEEVQNVFKLDALSSSHQISIPVNNPDEISEIFDHISYAKGASIIRMMRHFITAPVFQLGLQRYLRALKYNNAEQADLWSHLRVAQQELRLAAGKGTAGSQQLQDVDVGRVMNSWTLQTGYPLVTLTRNYNTQAGAQLDQVRYQPYKIVQDAYNNNNKTITQAGPMPAGASQNRWEIPITYTWKSEQNWEPTTRLWMRQNQLGPVEIAPSGLPQNSSEWVILNMQQVGYYRVNYDLQNWRYLIRQLQEDHTKISTTNRAQLLDDLFELARSSLVDYQLAMESTRYLRNERDYLPWESALLALGTIDEMLQRTPLYGEWQDYFARVIEPLYARYKDFDWTKSNRTTIIDTNDVLEQYSQVNAISWACQTDNQHCIDKARRVFASWRQSGRNDIQPSMRYAAYCAAIQYGNKDDWDFLWRVYEREQGAVERDRILRALGCSRQMWILARYLDWIFDRTKPIRRQDGAFVFRMIAKNNYGRDIAFNFMRERWPTIREYYGKTSFTLGHLIKSVASGMNTQVELEQLKQFHESIKNDVGTGKRSFQIAIEEVESNLYWRNKNYKILGKWLQENQKERKQEAPALAA